MTFFGSFFTNTLLHPQESHYLPFNNVESFKFVNLTENDDRVVFESFINIRPRDGNQSMIIQSDDIKKQIKAIIEQLVEFADG